MSCGCNSNPCSCQPRPSVCCIPTTESVEYTYENANLVGVGFFDNETDNLVQFRGAYSDNASLLITLDAGNNALKFSFDPAALITDIPDATTTQRGIGETATNGEAQAKAATDKFLTPSNLAALGGSTTFAGFLELATDAETIAGVSTTLAVTPSGLAALGATNTTTTFADAVARGGASATFAGQFGGQQDTDQGYIAASTSAGDWNALFTFGASNDVGNVTTTVSNIGTTTWSGLGSGVINFTSAFMNFQSSSRLRIDTTSVLDLHADSFLQISTSTIPADSLLGTGSTNGKPASRLVSTFLSTANTQTYGIPTGTLARTTFTAYNGQTVSNPPTQAEMQIIDNALVIVSQRLAALITDLIVNLKPTG